MLKALLSNFRELANSQSRSYCLSNLEHCSIFALKAWADTCLGFLPCRGAHMTTFVPPIRATSVIANSTWCCTTASIGSAVSMSLSMACRMTMSGHLPWPGPSYPDQVELTIHSPVLGSIYERAEPLDKRVTNNANLFLHHYLVV